MYPDMHVYHSKSYCILYTLSKSKNIPIRKSSFAPFHMSRTRSLDLQPKVLSVAWFLRAKGTPPTSNGNFCVASRLGPIFTTLSRKAASNGSDNATPTTPSLGLMGWNSWKGWGRQPADIPNIEKTWSSRSLTNLTSANVCPRWNWSNPWHDPWAGLRFGKDTHRFWQKHFPCRGACRGKLFKHMGASLDPPPVSKEMDFQRLSQQSVTFPVIHPNPYASLLVSWCGMLMLCLCLQLFERLMRVTTTSNTWKRSKCSILFNYVPLRCQNILQGTCIACI